MLFFFQIPVTNLSRDVDYRSRSRHLDTEGKCVDVGTMRSYLQLSKRLVKEIMSKSSSQSFMAQFKVGVIFGLGRFLPPFFPRLPLTTTNSSHSAMFMFGC